MPGEQTADGIIQLPADYQIKGAQEVEGDATVYEYDFGGEINVDSLPEATIESWLVDYEAPEVWVALRTQKLKVRIRGMTEEERKAINKRAPRIVNRQTKRPEADSEWVNLELVRQALVAPVVPTHDLLRKAMAGDLAYLASEIGKISGFDMGDASD